ncbi:hypothetical protein Ais01nite_26010 [Asanoa ishikariensis]|uniref:TIR domain-containing protein n=1 Tax=Asanoa ishikariensis TaxID=137265 RepID=A0A1H3QZP9_9ACTN|nr:toll/interleukin-1 receptor domain-containing protein [Asanoa ishikariensis]GIF64566.1 hypothetical protein Ais01nite_26010 [Asanoa ishikariensis]SDZ18723.1 TIR domain-containing protein [Asanoa ishikariensis]
MRGSTANGFDVFIGYNGRDRGRVLPIVRALRSRGIAAWVDEFELPPGRLFQDEIDRVLRSCRSAALFVGADGVGPWEQLEIKAAISQFLRRGLPVIPVLLDDAGPEPDLPLFLREFRMVRFAQETAFDLTISDLVWGITGSRDENVGARRTGSVGA